MSESRKQWQPSLVVNVFGLISWATFEDKTLNPLPRDLINMTSVEWWKWLHIIHLASRLWCWSAVLQMQQPMRSDIWLRDRKCQGLWVKWVLARVCGKAESAPVHTYTRRSHANSVEEEGCGARTHPDSHVFCGHLGLIKGKRCSLASSFKDKTKCCDVIPHQTS